MKPPNVSVVIGAYNCGEFIQKTIYSVINQTFKDWELIVVDDCSGDDTYEKVKDIPDERIRIIRLDKNSGLPAVSRNKGIEVSKGEFIAFLDHDDIWDKRKLERQLLHFRVPEIIGVVSSAIFVAKTPYYRKINFGRSKMGYVDYQYRDILTCNPILTSSVIIRRDILERSGLFNEDKNFFAIEDWDLWLRMARYGSFRVLEDPLLHYVVSRKRGYQDSIISKNSLKILEKQVDLGYVRDDDIIEPKVLIYLAIARNLLEFDQRQSRKYYMEALKNTSDICRKIKSCTGALISLHPFYLRKIILLILYKADLILYSLREQLWKIIKIFYRTRCLISRKY